MSLLARMSPSATKVLIITGCWTALLLVTYVSTYLFVGDLVVLGKLSGTYEFWPDFFGNAVFGVVGGLVGGSLLVYKVNAGYRHPTFLSGIAHSAAMFAVIFVGASVVILFSLPFVAETMQSGVAQGLRSGWRNLAINFQTPSFVANVGFVGLLVCATQFMLQVNDKFGPGVMWQLLRGKYYHPRDEERIFMFLDLRSSTQIAEQIGHKRFFELLREVFQDVTQPVVESRGDIYQYVGDEVVITWPVQRGVQDGNCLECFFRIERVLDGKRDHYLARFGVAPSFKAGVHVGEATVGEIGVIKKDIVFSGDVLNTTARIQQECNRHAVDLLASADLLGRVAMQSAYVTAPIGEIQLRGKAEALSLASVRRVASAAA